MRCEFLSTIERSFLESSSIEESAALRAHMETCATCRTTFQAQGYMETLLVGAFRVLESEAPPAPSARLLDECATPAGRKGPDPDSQVGNLRHSARLGPPGRTFNWRLVLYVNGLAALLLISILYVGFRAAASIKTRSYRTLAKTNVKAIGNSLESYAKTQADCPPAGIENLVRALIATAPRDLFLTDYLDGHTYSDPWGNPYVYKRTNGTAVIYSRGENERDEDGDGDDIAFLLKT